jgi:hypothetical protein
MCYHRSLDLTITHTLNYSQKPQQLADVKIQFVNIHGYLTSIG